ncbi:MAG: right-handed parallel beta-helix repeat-containing protein, partial [Planctomycetota bacterium]
ATIIIDVNVVLSGFTVMGGNSYNIFGITDAPEWAKAPVISNCIIRDGYEMGLESYSFGVGGISISNCIIYNNNKEGIHLANYAEAAIVENCIIYDNGTGGAGSGIKVGGSSTSSIIRNNTIVDNNDFGIEKVPGAADPCISNCILWGNVAGQLDDCSATYSCIQEGDTNDWNLNSDPCFVNADSNDYHIKSYSDCVDAGDPNDPNDPNTAGLDIDGELRIINGRVDIGADELGPLCWFYPTQCHGDADGSGTVNTTDFYILRVALYTSYGDANYNPCGDFDRDGYVDDNDVNILAEYWYTYPDANCPEGGVWPPEVPPCWFYPTQCHADADGSGHVNSTDFGIVKYALYTSYGDPNYNPCGDFDRDGYVDDDDVDILIEYYLTYPDANCTAGGVWPPEL